MVFQALWSENEDNLPIALHHGSLDVGQRRRVEAAVGGWREDVDRPAQGHIVEVLAIARGARGIVATPRIEDRQDARDEPDGADRATDIERGGLRSARCVHEAIRDVHHSKHDDEARQSDLRRRETTLLLLGRWPNRTLRHWVAFCWTSSRW